MLENTTIAAISNTTTITDWLMVIITIVYVIATIFICRANIKSAEATKEQLKESQKQFKANNRPYISCQYILSARTFCGIRFTNYGNVPAYNVKFKINEDFIDALKLDYKAKFGKLNDSEYYFGVKQYYDFYFSQISDFNENKHPFIVTITYNDKNDTYEETIEIKLDKQLPVESVTDFEEKVVNKLTEMVNCLKELNKKIK